MLWSLSEDYWEAVRLVRNELWEILWEYLEYFEEVEEYPELLVGGITFTVIFLVARWWNNANSPPKSQKNKRGNSKTPSTSRSNSKVSKKSKKKEGGSGKDDTASGDDQESSIDSPDNFCATQSLEETREVEDVVEQRHLRPKKSILMAYAFFFLGGFITGTHHMYLESYEYATSHLLTGGYFFMGTVMDFFLLPCYVSRHNRRCHQDSKVDVSCTRIFRRLGQVILILLVLLLLVVFGGPSFYEQVTGENLSGSPGDANPFDVLGIPRNSDFETARTAFKALSKKHHPDLGGDKKMMSKVNAAMDSLKKGHHGSSDATWSDFAETIGSKWVNFFERYRENNHPDDPSSASSSGKTKSSTFSSDSRKKQSSTTNGRAGTYNQKAASGRRQGGGYQQYR